jgi:hypothetical protein
MYRYLSFQENYYLEKYELNHVIYDIFIHIVMIKGKEIIIKVSRMFLMSVLLHVYQLMIQ